MDRRSYLLLRRAAIAGVVFASILVVSFLVYRGGTVIPGSAFGVGTNMLVVAAALAVGIGFFVYLWRLETRTGSSFADAPKFFGDRAASSPDTFEDYDEVIVPLSDGRYPREQKLPASHTNVVKVSVHGQSASAQVDMTSTPPTLTSADEDQSSAWEAMRSRYPIVNQLAQTGHRPAIDLMEVAGLTRVEKTDHRNPDGTITHVLSKKAPALVGIVDHPRGLELVFEPLSGQDQRMWDRAKGKMSTQLGLTSLSTRQDGVKIVVAFNDKIADLPLSKPLTEPIRAEVTTGKLRAQIGMSAYGPAFIQFANNSGCVIGGVPGSGKTASMLPVFAGLANLVEMHVADGKLGLDLEPLTAICRTYDNLGGYELGRLYALLKSLKFLVDSRCRALAIQKATGIANFWNSDPQVREAAGLYPIFVVIDECQYWFDPGSTGMSKEDKAACDAVISIVRELIQRGRSLGIMVILTTQKPDANTIPTVIRDNASLKIAFRVTTREQGRTILGALGQDQESPVDITQDTPGRCVMDVEGYGSNLIQTNYVSPDDITTFLTQHRPVPDQFKQAVGYPLAMAMAAFNAGEYPPEPKINRGADTGGHMAVVDDPEDLLQSIDLGKASSVDDGLDD
ncbi:zonular occludens toxin domain-containing protein [Gordonia sihwensis]|uniref:zonular occludens toxin domain-containing protein n=1 Tax=Gordonia sihwensis TaxID=173559 RepID=UPI003D953455